jgi:isoleucyl-tRNA synthetase
VRRCLAWYEQYEFHKVYRAVYDFAITDLSALYFDVSKGDHLYTTGPAAPERRSAQTALYRLNYAFVRLLAPVLSFTCEEVWRHTMLPAGSPQSVHMDFFPKMEELTAGFGPRQRQEAADWERLVPVRDEVLKALDRAREDKVIGSSLEAAVRLGAEGELYGLLEKHTADLPTWFIVSQLELRPAAGVELEIAVDRARGDKCERCWKYKLDVGSNPDFPTVCASCAQVLPEFLT